MGAHSEFFDVFFVGSGSGELNQNPETLSQPKSNGAVRDKVRLDGTNKWIKFKLLPLRKRGKILIALLFFYLYNTTEPSTLLFGDDPCFADALNGAADGDHSQLQLTSRPEIADIIVRNPPEPWVCVKPHPAGRIE